MKRKLKWLIAQLINSDNPADVQRLLNKIEKKSRCLISIRELLVINRTDKGTFWKINFTPIRNLYRYCTKSEPLQKSYINVKKTYPKIMIMWAYYTACKWLTMLGNMNDEETAKYRSDWPQDDWKAYFQDAKDKFSAVLSFDCVKDEVYKEFRHIPYRLDMSNRLYHQQYCDMLYCVSKMFEEMGDRRCLEGLQKCGFVVDCYIIDDNHANTKLLLEAIKNHSQEEMSYLFVAWAFQIINRFHKTGYTNKMVAELHEMLAEKIISISDNDFVGWVHEMNINKGKYCKMFNNLTQDVFDNMLSLAKKTHNG